MNFGKGNSKTFETVNAAGHGEEVDLIPTLKNLILPFLQSPFSDHTGPKAVEMLTIHGVHDASVRVNTDEIFMLFHKGIKNRHFDLLLHVGIKHTAVSINRISTLECLGTG